MYGQFLLSWIFTGVRIDGVMNYACFPLLHQAMKIGYDLLYPCNPGKNALL
jgi:hypothetical protein